MLELKPGGIPKEGSSELMGGLPKRGFLRDSIQNWNDRTHRYEVAWEHRFNKRVEHVFFEKFNAIETGPYESVPFFCAPYRNCLVMIHLYDTVGAPTRLLLTVWFSYDGDYWFWYMRDFYGRLEWEDTDLPRRECFDVPILAPYIQIRIGITGGSAQAYFPIFVKAVFDSV
jgi:hypothetical protein